MAALREQMFRPRFLKISTSNLIAWYLRRDGEDRHAAALTIVEAVNQVKITWTTASGAAANLPVRYASAPAAKAAVSS
jgi:hypothetical protein